MNRAELRDRCRVPVMLQAKAAAGREHQGEDAGSPSRFKYKLTWVRYMKSNPSSTEQIGKRKEDWG